MTSTKSERQTLPALQAAASNKNNTTPGEDAFLKALPQLIKLRSPCPCSKPGFLSLRERNLVEDPQELITRYCQGGDEGFQTWIDYMKHARPLKDFAHQCIRHYIQEQQVSSTGRDRGQLHESKKNGPSHQRGASGSVATRPLQLSHTMKLDSTNYLTTSIEEETECLPPLIRTVELQVKRRQSLRVNQLQHDPLIIEVTGLKLPEGSTRTKILKAMVAALPEARTISPNNVYPKLDPATGEYLGSFALEFSKTEKGRMLWYLVSLSFPSVPLEPGDEEALSVYPDLASKVEWKRACFP